MEPDGPQRDDQLALFFEQAPSAVAIFDAEMRLVAVSQRFLSNMAALFSPRVFTPADVIGRTQLEVFPGFPSHWREIHARVLAGEELSEDADPVQCWDGRCEWVRWSMKPWRNADGRIGGVLLVSDISTREVEARQALAESEERFRATFENAGAGIAHLDNDLACHRANTVFARVAGWPAQELLRKTVHDITYPDDLAGDLAQFEAMRHGRIDGDDREKRYVGKDGSVSWARVVTSCVRHGDGSVDYFVCVAQDINALKHAEEMLRRQADLLDQSHDAIFTWKLGGGIAYWSRGAEALYGYSRDEAIGRVSRDLLRARARIPAGDVEKQLAREDSWCGELAHTTRDGREIIVESRQVRVAYGREVYILESNRDITERKRAEEQIRLVMREANHRAKNALGLVQAIARQTAAGEPGEFVDRFSERLQALAANHDLLVRHEWQAVDMAALVRSQLAPFAELIGTRITVDGPQLQVNAAAVQVLGLALHELATNAGKYGALSTQSGHVDVGWRLDGDTLAMSWIERDGPTVQPPSRSGFGSTVTGAMVMRSLDGEVDLDYAPSGLTWRLTCPAANALERRP